MTEDVAVKSYIDDLFRYLDTYETSYAQFETEAFLQTYNGICAVFQALRKQRDKAVAVDEYFLGKIKQAPLTSSDLRQVTIQVLITFFESEADIDGQSDRAYSYCRGIRAAKQDVPFFESHLLPILFRDASLNNNLRLNSFLLSEIARYLNRFGRPLAPDLTPEQFAAMGDPMKFLVLARRRQLLGQDLLTDRSSLEFHLQRIDAFSKLRQKGKLYEHYLKEWRYLAEKNFWVRVKAFFAELGGKIRGVFSSSRYFRLSLTQRNTAYLFYGLVIVFFILLALYVPMKWSQFSQGEFDQLEQRAQTIQREVSR
ncbi:MAG: hypothetical protein AB1744_08165 [Candidatus Zixiibacteriota bacterium]